MLKKGKFIVFEGIDGSGKTVQLKLLVDYLRKNNIANSYISFPRYEKSMWGQMVKRFLTGEFGNINQVDPYFASMLYAGDRFGARDEIKNLLSEGKIVVCNRYVGSNIGHMAAKFKKPIDRQRYITWLEKLEYGENKIPKEDLVMLLQVPPGESKKLMKGRNLDIHEKNQKYQTEVYRVYDYVAKHKNNWETIECFKNNKLLLPQKIHEKVLEVLNNRKII